MPGIKPPLPPLQCPFSAQERDTITSSVAALLDEAADDEAVDRPRIERIVLNLVTRDQVGSDEVAEARLLAARLLGTRPELARTLRRIADRRATQIADREPAWIRGNPASDLRQA